MGYGAFDYRPKLKDVDKPTLVIVGEHDRTTTPRASRVLHEGIQGSELVVIHLGNVLAIELVAAGCRCIKTTEHIHERRFTAPARPHDGKIFVAAYLQGHTAQRAHDFLAHDVVFGDILNVDHNRAERSD